MRLREITPLRAWCACAAIFVAGPTSGQADLHEWSWADALVSEAQPVDLAAALATPQLPALANAATAWVVTPTSGIPSSVASPASTVVPTPGAGLLVLLGAGLTMRRVSFVGRRQVPGAPSGALAGEAAGATVAG